MSCLIPAVVGQNMPPQDQGKRYGDPGFVGEPINLNVVNADIRDILNYITEQYGINFVIDKSVKSVPVTVNVNDVPWNVALDSILQAQELGVQVNGPILRIAAKQTLATEYERDQKIRDSQLDTSPLYTEFIRLNYARAAGAIGSATTTSGVVAGGNTGAGSSGGAQTGGGEGLLPIIKRRLSRRGSIEVDARSNTLIITDVRENIDAVRQLVGLLDQPEPQVEIEARIVVATRTFSRDLGVQLAGLVLGPRGSGASLGTLPGAQGATGGGTGTGAQTGAGLNPGGIPTGIGTPPNNSLISSIPNTVIGLTTGIFGTAQISLMITAGEQKGQAKTIATPRVTTLNNRKAEIQSAIQIPVVTVQPGSSAGGAAVATTEYVNVPLRLEITPQITDAGTVILSVGAENSSLAGGGAINTQSVITEVMVPDGGTTVIGGVLSDDEREEQDRTPGLSRVPLLGNLFKRKGVFRDTSEVLFFITPRIYRPDYSGNPTSGKVSDSTRTTTLIQPVPLGNPPSNSDVPTNTQQPLVPVTPLVPVSPTVQPGTNPNNPNNP
ncbi:MAG TPA: type IV pilus secretin PilQ [Pyrinomonadaceae bacterium]|nr:type IV pilus secretin PilQ [Pyrinomonadaceae bacterium]